MSKAQPMWAIHHADGTFEQVFSAKRPRAKRASVWQIDRFGDLTAERHDPVLGWVPLDQAALHRAIDAAHDAEHPMRRVIDYAIKQIEARLILGELETNGLLAREAALRGMPIEALAQRVLSRADAECPELQRLAAKFGEGNTQCR